MCETQKVLEQLHAIVHCVQMYVLHTAHLLRTILIGERLVVVISSAGRPQLQVGVSLDPVVVVVVLVVVVLLGGSLRFL